MMKNEIGNKSFAKLEEIHFLVACKKGLNVKWKEHFFNCYFNSVNIHKSCAIFIHQLYSCNKYKMRKENVWVGLVSRSDERCGGGGSTEKQKREEKQ